MHSTRRRPARGCGQRVSTLLCLGSVLLLVLSTPLITGAFSDHAAVFSAAMLGLLLLQAVCSYDVCLSGIIALLRFRFDQYSMLFLALCVVVADAFFAVAEGRTPFCTVAGILLLLALWGRDLLYDARRRSLRAISNMDEPYHRHIPKKNIDKLWGFV